MEEVRDFQPEPAGMPDSSRELNEIEDLIGELEKDHDIVKKMKAENRKLKAKIKGLIRNNEKMLELLREIEKKEEKAMKRKKYAAMYSFQAHGMVRLEDLKKHKMAIEEKKVTVQDINNQLTDILGKLEAQKRNI